MTINKVVIACFKKDLLLLRSCVASVRYWHPDAEIYLLKDYIRGPFSTTEIERHWGARVFESSRSVFGWPWSKLAVIFRQDRERYLFLDSDVVLLGPVLDALGRFDDDFIVTGIRGEAASADINDNYIDMSAVKAFDPAYRFPGFGFNGGQIVMTSGILQESDFASVIEWEPAITNRRPGIFKHGDQGVLNYVFANAARLGRITLRYADFWIWPGLPQADAIDLDALKRKDGVPYVLHWAGIKPTDFRRSARYDILSFYNDVYYSRVPLGAIRRALRHLGLLAVVKLKILKYTVLRMPYQ